METYINSCIKDWDLFHEFNDTKIVFVTEIEYPRFKKDNNEKTKENRDKNNKDERGVKPE